MPKSMPGFTTFRLVTSTLRWLIHFSYPAIMGSRYLILTPPWFKNQRVRDLKQARYLRLRIQSYFDWATVLEVFGRDEYFPKQDWIESAIEACYLDSVRNQRQPLILDLGANVGVTANMFSSRFEKALIVAVEPHSGNFAQLELNCSQLGNVSCLRAAVAVSDGQVSIFDGPEAANNAFRTFGPSESSSLGVVDALSPNSLLQRYAQASPFVLKIDIEGFEQDLFSGDCSWIDQFPVVMTELHDWMLPGSASSNPMLAALLRRKRDLVISGENLIAISVEFSKAADTSELPDLAA